ncbi:MAG: hypothetical protein MJE68_04915 [Proteobacteria bacterium]|nr:hypothetical protein [Pseudomonadota bacterium]
MDAEFTVTAASFISFGGLNVNIALSEDPPGIVADTPPLTVNFPYSRYAGYAAAVSSDFAVSTFTGAPTGTLIARVTPGTGYTVSSPNAAGPVNVVSGGNSGLNFIIREENRTIIAGENAVFNVFAEMLLAGVALENATEVNSLHYYMSNANHYFNMSDTIFRFVDGFHTLPDNATIHA